MTQLMLLFCTPLIASVLITFLWRLSSTAVQKLAFVASMIPLLLLLYGGSTWIGTTVSYPWITALPITFHLAIDSLSLLFLYLVACVVPVAIVAAPVSTLPNAFFGLILFLEALLIGFFTARDLVVFVVFWEAMLIPLYLIIAFWGGQQRRAAAMRFLIYMIAGSVFLVAALLTLYFLPQGTAPQGTFDIDALAKIVSQQPLSYWVGAAFLLAFVVKTPLFPFHAWLPDAYCQAPLGGTILLSALLSKAGIYGILRIGLGLFPTLIARWSSALIALAVVGVLYGALVAWRQQDFKRLIAYSSFSHVNFVLVGLFVSNETAYIGSILQAINHGVTITGLFLVAGWLEQRLHSTALSKAGGLAKPLPYLCWFSLVFALSSVALPGTNSFVGEILIFLGLFRLQPWMTALLATSVILSAVYMLHWMQALFFGPQRSTSSTYRDLSVKEGLVLIPLVAAVVGLGLYPTPLLDQATPYAQSLVTSTENTP